MPLDRIDIDKICDYVPFVSSFTNIIDLVQKKRFQEEDIQQEPPPLKSRYVTYIENKSDIRCAILIFPIIGNVVVGLYDIVKAFVSLFSENEEDQNIEIGGPKGFKHVSSGTEAPKKSAEDVNEQSLADQIDAKIKAYKEKEAEESDEGFETDPFNNQDIYSNPPLKSKLEEIPHQKRRAYLESLGFTSGFYADNDEFARRLLGSLSRNSSKNDPIRKKLNVDASETEYLQHFREMPEKEVMDILIEASSQPKASVLFREKFLMFLMLDPRLKFERHINDNLSNLAVLMMEADETLRDRLTPLIKKP